MGEVRRPPRGRCKSGPYVQVQDVRGKGALGTGCQALGDSDQRPLSLIRAPLTSDLYEMEAEQRDGLQRH